MNARFPVIVIAIEEKHATATRYASEALATALDGLALVLVMPDGSRRWRDTAEAFADSGRAYWLEPPEVH